LGGGGNETTSLYYSILGGHNRTMSGASDAGYSSEAGPTLFNP